MGATAQQEEEEIVGRAYDARLMKRLLTYLTPYRTVIAGSGTLLILTSGLEVLRPYLLMVAIDSYIVPARLEGLWGLALLYLGILALGGGVQYGQLFLTHWTGQRVMADLRLEIFRHLKRLPLRYFDRNPAGRIFTRVTSDVENLKELFTSGLVSAIGDLLTAAAIVAAMLYLDLKLSLIAFAIIPLLITAVTLFQKKARGAYRLIRQKVSRLNASLQESLNGMEVIQAFGREEAMATRFAGVNAEHREATLRSLLYYALFYPAVEVIAAVGLGLIIWYGGGQVVRETITLGVLVAFLEYLQRFFTPIKDLSEKYYVMQSAMASSERIFDLLDEPPEPDGNGYRMRSLRGAIEFRDVWFAYRPGEHILKGLSFTVEPGERVALIGATGAGKSTVVNLLTRLYEIERGAILVDGRDIRGLDLTALRQRIGLIPQDPFLFSESLATNLQVGHGVSPEEVNRSLELAGAAPVVERLPAGLQTRLTERGASLSMGERQLIGLARAMVYAPDILILDEATSNVDPATEAEFSRRLRHLTAGKTLIIIAHRLQSAAEADRILVLHHGELLEKGTHQELLARQGLYARLWYLQHDGSPHS
ncbi:MAG: ABC transporter ATP-binding protein [candidate division NC10 bacterium]|jgi:ATP-binding cassette subfamily B protein|nr:ABC transporter ATP-binding protein [candidate division NC10 bacterium]MCZ6551442.1 ABC transporter ATP-binding protein [candidate division NC10 bacterium]